MGTLRVLFAISVVFAHAWTPGIVFVGGRNAVQLFYTISGFLISYVLIDGGVYRKLRFFYINRFLRLYPVYFVVAVLTLFSYIFLPNLVDGAASFFEVYKQAPLAANFLLTISNLCIFGQDWVLFSGVKNGNLVFSSDFMKSEIVLYPGLVVPQAWTLGVELSFYLIAPLVLVRRRLLYAALALSLGVRVYLVYAGLGLKDPWVYRFFPAELALFLLGALSHQVLLPLYRKLCAGRFALISDIATYSLIILCVIYFLIPFREIWKSIFIISLFIGLLPFTFVFQNRHAIDNWLGGLSYPIYIGHLLILLFVTHFFSVFRYENKLIFAFACVVFSIAFAVILNRAVDVPFARIRARFRQAPATHPVA